MLRKQFLLKKSARLPLPIPKKDKVQYSIPKFSSRSENWIFHHDFLRFNHLYKEILNYHLGQELKELGTPEMVAFEGVL